MKYKKTISPVVATALLLVVGVVSVVGFQNWFNLFSSDLFTDIETKSNSRGNIQIENVIGSILYLKNSDTENITVTSIKMNNNTCNINSEYAIGISEINLTSCLESYGQGAYYVVVYTTKGVFSKKLVLREYTAP